MRSEAIITMEIAPEFRESWLEDHPSPALSGLWQLVLDSREALRKADQLIADAKGNQCLSEKGRGRKLSVELAPTLDRLNSPHEVEAKFQDHRKFLQDVIESGLDAPESPPEIALGQEIRARLAVMGRSAQLAILRQSLQDIRPGFEPPELPEDADESEQADAPEDSTEEQVEPGPEVEPEPLEAAMARLTARAVLNFPSWLSGIRPEVRRWYAGAARVALHPNQVAELEILDEAHRLGSRGARRAVELISGDAGLGLGQPGRWEPTRVDFPVCT